MRTETQEAVKSYLIHVQGLVQGVGFRPFVFRLASEMHLKGWVENRNDGVYIQLLGSLSDLESLIGRIRQEAPQASSVLSVNWHEVPFESFSDFKIISSRQVSSDITQVSPDIAVCDQCLDDMEYQSHRLDYPFINCTNCGPRFSIIEGLPYDRPKTTMSPFLMCPACQSEYTDVFDRRFHAQPIACNHCGPIYQFENSSIKTNRLSEIFEILDKELRQGKIFAIKGLGGYHLLCDATNQHAVERIRTLKNREGKPFAIMAPSVETIQQIASVSAYEEELLTSWRRPIVLLEYQNGLAPGVTNGLGRVGVMLPYMPFHHLLFKKISSRFLVLTSGNISDEPILIDDQKAKEVFGDKVDGVLSYNREIYNRVDDSVVKEGYHSTIMIRRSRGFTPEPIITSLNTEGIFAAGAELVHSFCMGKRNQAIMSQYLGDLKNMETLEFFEETIQRFQKLFLFEPELLVTDLHPDYLSTKFAVEWATKGGTPIIKVQHHHAHIAGAMLSHHLDEEVIGVSLDGIGLGTDGKGWGAEFMKVSLSDFERMYHFDYIPMPGGDRAAKEPWRMALSYLHRVYGYKVSDLKLPLFDIIDQKQVDGIIQVLERKIHTPEISSVGRLFDAVASIVGVAHWNTFQAEAPMRLESIADSSDCGTYSYSIYPPKIIFDSLIQEVVEDVIKGISPSVISSKFHQTLALLIVDICSRMADESGLNKIVLSGGTFLNSLLTQGAVEQLSQQGFKVYLPEGIPVNDQGIAVGQLAVAAKRRLLGLI